MTLRRISLKYSKIKNAKSCHDSISTLADDISEDPLWQWEWVCGGFLFTCWQLNVKRFSFLSRE